MRPLTALLAALTLALTLAPAAGAEDYAGLVRRLGAADYAAREDASRQLAAAGVAARVALEAGRGSPDAEVRARAARLLDLVLTRDLDGRVAAYLADPARAPADGLPLIAEFRAAAGTDAAARLLYAETLKRYAAPLDAAAREPNRAAAVYAAFCKDTHARMKPSRLLDRPGDGDRAELAAAFLLGLHPQATNSAAEYAHLSNLLRIPALPAALSRDAAGTDLALRRLFVGWANRQSGTRLAPRLLLLGTQAGLSEMLPLALSLMADAAAPAKCRAQALLAVGRLGTRAHLPAVEALLSERQTVYEVGVNDRMSRVELGDVALAMAVHLSGAKVRDYPFDRPSGRAVSFSEYYQYGFADDAARAKARQKWAGR